jgi:RNA polymerase primary sigma factor
MRRAGQRLDHVVDELTRRNLRLVLWMARKYKNRTFYLDMIQEGNVGLMRAARKFDHRKGARFGSYAGWWIRQSIEGFLSRHSRTIRIPVNTLGAVRRIGKAELDLAEKNHRAPSDAELAVVTGIAVDEVARARRVAHDLEKGCVALDGPIDGEHGATLNDVIPDVDAAAALDRLDNEQMEGAARELLGSLEAVEARVLNMRFGLVDDERWTLAEVGEQIGLTKERIRQIEMKALGKLRFRAKRLGVRP